MLLVNEAVPPCSNCSSVPLASAKALALVSALVFSRSWPPVTAMLLAAFSVMPLELPPVRSSRPEPALVIAPATPVVALLSVMPPA